MDSLDPYRFRSGPFMRLSRTRIWKTATTWSESTAWSGSESRSGLWRNGNEEQILLRKWHKNLPKNVELWTFVAEKQSKPDNSEVMHVHVTRGWSHCCESTVDSHSGFTEQGEFFGRCKRVLTILKQRAALERPTFPANPWLFRVSEKWPVAILDCRMVQRLFIGLSIVFESEKDHPQLSSKIPGICFIFSRIETWYYRKHHGIGKRKARAAEFVNNCVTLPKGLVELILMMLSWITRDLQKVGSKDSRSSAHCVPDQKKLRWQCRLTSSWHRDGLRNEQILPTTNAWCDDWVSIEKASRQACALSKKSKCRIAGSL